jgi:hypothetical protein
MLHEDSIPGYDVEPTVADSRVLIPPPWRPGTKTPGSSGEKGAVWARCCVAQRTLEVSALTVISAIDFKIVPVLLLSNAARSEFQ